MKPKSCLFAVIIILVMFFLNSAMAVLAESVLNMPEALNIIEKEAFYGSTSIDKVVLHDNVTEIRARAFANSSLKKINLPESLVSISNTAFNGTSLTGVEAVKGTYAYSWAVENGYIKKEQETDPDIFTYSKSNGVAVVTGFVDTSNYPNNIVIPGKTSDGFTITSIGDNAFYGLDLLKSVSLYENITRVGKGAFSHCNNLREVYFSEGLTTIEGNPYSYDSDTGYGAFSHCIKLANIYIPSTVTSIGNYAFYGCSQLKQLMIRPSDDYEMSIGNGAFARTVIAGRMTLPAKVKNIGKGAFQGLPITSLIISEGNHLSSISENAFQGCESLASVTIPGNVKTIEASVFNGCRSLKTVNLSEGLTAIEGNPYTYDSDTGYGAFSYCTKLTSITIPSTVTSIGKYAFYGCSQLASLMIKPSDDYEMSIGDGAFVGTVIAGKMTLPAKVKGIGKGAFQGLPITSLIISEGNHLSSISENAFQGCESLASVTIPGNVKTIEASVFNGCRSLKTVNLSEGLTAIEGNPYTYDSDTGYGAFSYCTKLTSITIPSTVTSIGKYAFYDDAALSVIRIKAEKEAIAIGDSAFGNCPGTPVYVN